MPKKTIKPIRVDFTNSETPNYIQDISWNKLEEKPEYSRKIINLADLSEREKLALIFDLIDTFENIIIYKKESDE